MSARCGITPASSDLTAHDEPKWVLTMGRNTQTFEAVHFGVRQRLCSEIVEYHRPRRFTDRMVRGTFKSLRHVHEFEALGVGTVMRDILTWESPLGILGIMADRLAVHRHMRSFLLERNKGLKKLAEMRARDLTRG